MQKGEGESEGKKARRRAWAEGESREQGQKARRGARAKKEAGPSSSAKDDKGEKLVLLVPAVVLCGGLAGFIVRKMTKPRTTR